MANERICVLTTILQNGPSTTRKQHYLVSAALGAIRGGQGANPGGETQIVLYSGKQFQMIFKFKTCHFTTFEHFPLGLPGSHDGRGSQGGQEGEGHRDGLLCLIQGKFKNIY